MVIDHPASRHMDQLRGLWKIAFGDTDAFLDSFFRTAYAPQRCLCVLEKDTPAAVLYWMDCSLEGRKLAYIYAVATHPDFRGRGLCRRLMAHAHELLKTRGYAGAILVPVDASLRKMYASMGYKDAGGLREIQAAAAEEGCDLRALGPEEFAGLRRGHLPAGSVVQEGAGLSFLAEQLQFYAGQDFLLAAYSQGGVLHGMELLGNSNAVPQILKALECSRGVFRIPGEEIPFAMYRPLIEDKNRPLYFGFAFD